MQYASTIPSVYTQKVLELNLAGLNGSTGPISEDSLTLSIWAPRNSKKKNLPILISFYGGAFIVGGTNVPYQLPGRSESNAPQGHIVVSFNHRDNIFGFPNAANLPPKQQNVMLLDQRLAVEWMRDNIASFSGDPTRIGLWGQSSGAITIAYCTYAYAAGPVANSIILDSGTEFTDLLTRDPANTNFTAVAGHFNCAPLPPAAELACMRRVDAHTLSAYLRAYTDTVTPPVTFSLTIDNHTVFATYPPPTSQNPHAP